MRLGPKTLQPADRGLDPGLAAVPVGSEGRFPLRLKAQKGPRPTHAIEVMRHHPPGFKAQLRDGGVPAYRLSSGMKRVLFQGRTDHQNRLQDVPLLRPGRGPGFLLGRPDSLRGGCPVSVAARAGRCRPWSCLTAACQAWRKPSRHAGFCPRDLCLPTALLPGQREAAFHGNSLGCTGRGEFLGVSTTRVGLFLASKTRADAPPIALSIAVGCGEGEGWDAPPSPEVLGDHTRTREREAVAMLPDLSSSLWKTIWNAPNDTPANTGKPPKCPPMDEWVPQARCTDMTEYTRPWQE